MSALHTPGPWFLFGNGHCVGGPAPEGQEASPTAGVAMCGMGRRSPAECAANAQLISAAPELLAALLGVVRVADRATDEFDAARLAIAKATGGAS